MSKKEVCDVCGAEISGKGQFVMIEGAKLKVCYNCSKFGTKIKDQPKRPERPAKKTTYIRKPRGLDYTEEMELVENFNKIIKSEREKRGWTQEQLAQKIYVRDSIIRKIEGGRIPTDEVREKLEKILGINLLTVADEGDKFLTRKEIKDENLTLGDVVRLKKRKEKGD